VGTWPHPVLQTLLAVGGSETTAYTAGVNVAAVRTLAYTLGGAIAGLAGVAIVAQLHEAEADAGFVTRSSCSRWPPSHSGTSITGGAAALLGALLGAAVISSSRTCSAPLGLSSFLVAGRLGATLIVAVVFAAITVARAWVTGEITATALAWQ